MRRFIAMGSAGIALVFSGYAASGIGSAGMTTASTSSSTGLSTESTTSTSTETRTTATTAGPPKITICHRTTFKRHPYLRIRVSGAALKRHLRHRGDIIPAPGGVCPHHVVKVRDHRIVYKHLPN
jgi:hypothetical protein